MRIQQVLALPTPTAEEETHIAHLVRIVSLTIEVALTIYAVGLLSSGQHFTPKPRRS
jgi:hypothetical protein